MTHDGRRAAVRPYAGLLLVVSVAAGIVAAVVLVRAATTPSDSSHVSAQLASASQTAPAQASDQSTARWPWTSKPQQPDKPSVLALPSLGVEMPIKAVGVADDGEMAMPSHPTEIGWYRFGPAPGSKHGATVLAGHVDSKEYGVGPLAKLRGSKPGDTVVVKDKEGEPQTYRVTKTEVISKQTIALDRVFTRSGRPVLHILTCGGAFLPDRGGYQDNVVVTAVPR